MQLAIETEAVGKSYGRTNPTVALRDLPLAVPPGTVLALLGHNGAGKTTAVRGLATLLEFDQGSARVAGHDVRSQAQRVRERIALVGQVAAVDEQLGAADNLELFGRLRGLPRSAARERARALLDQFGLSDTPNRPVQGFSGGMRRRLDLAAGLIVRPEVLFVDEPTTGLDPAARRDLWQTLRELVAQGTTILLTTQYLEEADALADHIVLLAHGRVVAEGTTDALKDALGPSTITVRFPHAEQARSALAVLARLDPAVRAASDTTVALTAHHSSSLLDTLGLLESQGLPTTEVALRKPSLDEVFLSLTENHTDHEDMK